MDPNRDPEHDPQKDRPGNGPQGSTGGAAENTAGVTPPDAPKPPPWQVPKPELRPELLNQPTPSVDPFAKDRERESLLDGGLRAGLDLRYSCTAGVCAPCRRKLLEGLVEMLANYAMDYVE